MPQSDFFVSSSSTLELSASLAKLRDEFPARFSLLGSEEIAELEECLLMMPEVELEGLLNNLRVRYQGDFADLTDTCV